MAKGRGPILPPMNSATLSTKQTLVQGRPSTVRCIDLNGQTYVLDGTLLRVAALEDEWFDDIADPHQAVEAFRLLTGIEPDVVRMHRTFVVSIRAMTQSAHPANACSCGAEPPTPTERKSD